MNQNNKLYKFNGKQFSLKEPDLGVLHEAVPMFAKYRKLHYQFTKDIDISPIELRLEETANLNKALEQLNETGEKDETKIKLLSEKISEIEAELKSDSQLKHLQKYYSDMEALAMYSLITDAELMQNILSRILLSDSGKTLDMADLAELYSSPEAKTFVKDVVSDFFYLTLGSMR
jgi:hypothetical protein